MSDTRMVIRQSHPPTRCEICHQSDVFDGAAGICLRCQGFVWNQPRKPVPRPAPTTIPIPNSPPVNRSPVSWSRRAYQKALSIALAVFGLIGGGVWWMNSGEAARVSNTAQAITHLRNLHIAQTAFAQGPGKGNYTSNVLFLGANPHGNCFCSDCVLRLGRVSSGSTETRFGYIMGPLEVEPATETTPARYAAFIYPENAGSDSTGSDAFFIDQTGIVRHSGSPYLIPNETSEPVR